jgi:C-terminal processing protease CtpA/Prc
MKLLSYLICAVLLLSVSSCEQILVDAPPASKDNAAVFDSLWETARNKYTFFEFKRIDWDAVREKYRNRAIQAATNEELFAVLATMLNELKDDHTNLFSKFNISRARPFFNDSANFDQEILNRVYLKNQDLITGSLVNAIVERNGKKYGYIRYSSFSSPLDSASWGFVVNRFRRENVEGMILDIRNNGGGALSNALFLASRLAISTATVLTEMTKNGPGRTDYNPAQNLTISVAQPAWNVKRVAILTNRNSYSAASFFPAMTKAPEYAHVRLVGDHTGGGSGLPIDFQLPNGWTYRFSGTKTFIPVGRISRAQALAAAPNANHDADAAIGYNFEWGVPVDIAVNMNLSDRSRDAIIERAVEYIANGR